MMSTRATLRKSGNLKWGPIWLIHTLDLPSLRDEFGHHDGRLAFLPCSDKQESTDLFLPDELFLYTMDETFTYGGNLSNDVRFFLCSTMRSANKVASLLRPEMYRLIRFESMYAVCAYDRYILDCLHSYFTAEEIEVMEQLITT